MRCLIHEAIPPVTPGIHSNVRCTCKFTEADYLRFLHTVSNTNPPGGQRRGQWIYNKLINEHPVIGRVPTEVDPFYVDENLPKFWTWLAEQITD